jgi:hypothetical protein
MPQAKKEDPIYDASSSLAIQGEGLHSEHQTPHIVERILQLGKSDFVVSPDYVSLPDLEGTTLW